jgi:hypothetical protein
MTSAIDALNPIRNKATQAHANDNLLGEAEAILVINTVRTMLPILVPK